jgi:hypothetical protein
MEPYAFSEDRTVNCGPSVTVPVHRPTAPRHHHILRLFLIQTTNNKVQNIHLRFPSTLFAKAAAALLLSSVLFL